jgi:hypothetical protein
MPHIALNWRQCTVDGLIYHLLPWSHTCPSCRAYMLLHGRPCPWTMIQCGRSPTYKWFFCLDCGSCFWIFLGDLFLDEVWFFGSSVFSSIWLIVKWCTVLLLHPCLVSFWVSLSISHFLFPLHGYATNRGGVLVYSRRYPKYSRRTLLLIPISPCVVRDRGRRSLSLLVCIVSFYCIKLGTVKATSVTNRGRLKALSQRGEV